MAKKALSIAQMEYLDRHWTTVPILKLCLETKLSRYMVRKYCREKGYSPLINNHGGPVIDKDINPTTLKRSQHKEEPPRILRHAPAYSNNRFLYKEVQEIT